MRRFTSDSSKRPIVSVTRLRYQADLLTHPASWSERSCLTRLVISLSRNIHFLTPTIPEGSSIQLLFCLCLISTPQSLTRKSCAVPSEGILIESCYERGLDLIYLSLSPELVSDYHCLQNQAARISVSAQNTALCSCGSNSTSVNFGTSKSHYYLPDEIWLAYYLPYLYQADALGFVKGHQSITNLTAREENDKFSDDFFPTQGSLWQTCIRETEPPPDRLPSFDVVVASPMIRNKLFRLFTSFHLTAVSSIQLNCQKNLHGYLVQKHISSFGDATDAIVPHYYLSSFVLGNLTVLNSEDNRPCGPESSFSVPALRLHPHHLLQLKYLFYVFKSFSQAPCGNERSIINNFKLNQNKYEEIEEAGANSGDIALWVFYIPLHALRMHSSVTSKHILPAAPASDSTSAALKLFKFTPRNMKGELGREDLIANITSLSLKIAFLYDDLQELFERNKKVNVRKKIGEPLKHAKRPLGNFPLEILVEHPSLALPKNMLGRYRGLELYPRTYLPRLEHASTVSYAIATLPANQAVRLGGHFNNGVFAYIILVITATGHEIENSFDPELNLVTT
ncbi:uncharacterized protein BDR25DRAFT_359678 [Lindgomyces ingoldianus]|uniref:Uncharacterized protein n=1 Tax=Lindgomyces ingoldianus TaxID=673940 RepID=A0ACB6QH43_9PLEO|nr:uncharacterized protein BDR25DRAFT_359678 [Lindgomyces ingoldianus]KAF2466309.1 hypothetical protein BDR25DRAFT_359678 [Lindgomyces ingoldianus]